MKYSPSQGKWNTQLGYLCISPVGEWLSIEDGKYWPRIHHCSPILWVWEFSSYERCPTQREIAGHSLCCPGEPKESNFDCFFKDFRQVCSFCSVRLIVRYHPVMCLSTAYMLTCPWTSPCTDWLKLQVLEEFQLSVTDQLFSVQLKKLRTRNPQFTNASVLYLVAVIFV